MENDSARCFGKRAKPRSRRRQRTYSLQICVPPLDGCAWEVVESIERQTIPVTDARDYNALDDVTDASGAILVDNDVKLSVPVTEWLAVGCQRISALPANKANKKQVV